MNGTKVIAICNQKGGVGKTTTVVALGAGLVEKGYKVLLLDIDDSGNPSLTKALGLNDQGVTLTDLLLLSLMDRGFEIGEKLKEAIQVHTEGMDAISADNKLPGIPDAMNMVKQVDKRFVLRKIIDEIKRNYNYDYIIIDSAPFLNIMTVNIFSVADKVIITSQPQIASEAGIEELLQTAKNVVEMANPRLEIMGVLITMMDNRTNYNKNKAAEMIETYRAKGIKVFESKIPRGVAAEQCMENKISVLRQQPKGKVALGYKAFVEEVLEV